MYFGTRYAFKSCAAAYAAATIGWLATLAGDRLGGLIVSPLSHQEVRPGKRRSGLMAVFHHLAEQSRLALPFDNSQSRINFLLSELLRVVKTWLEYRAGFQISSISTSKLLNSSPGFAGTTTSPRSGFTISPRSSTGRRVNIRYLSRA